ncbi:MAG: NVEALA domain-containing protein [Muribaculaceae bacterium]|nr:NVEALA domain-containing protein [Muribaculaceae bacterium]MDE6534028.1 NVEALA domain-containing protein [Muribaculaceae bacterium]
MRKSILFGLPLTVLAAVGAITSGNPCDQSLTPLQMENIESLTRNEAVIELGYDKACGDVSDDTCITSGYTVYEHATPRNW